MNQVFTISFLRWEKSPLLSELLCKGTPAEVTEALKGGGT